MKSDFVNNSWRVDQNVIISDNLPIYRTRYTVLATIIDTPKKSIFLHDNIAFNVKFLSCRKTKSISIDWKGI